MEYTLYMLTYWYLYISDRAKSSIIQELYTLHYCVSVYCILQISYKMVYIRVIGSIVELLFPVCLLHISLRFTGFLCLKNAKLFLQERVLMPSRYVPFPSPWRQNVSSLYVEMGPYMMQAHP